MSYVRIPILHASPENNNPCQPSVFIDADAALRIVALAKPTWVQPPAPDPAVAEAVRVLKSVRESLDILYAMQNDLLTGVVSGAFIGTERDLDAFLAKHAAERLTKG